METYNYKNCKNDHDNEIEYNHKSVFLFVIPLLYSMYLECKLYTIINTIWLLTGFTYHFSFFIKGELSGIVIILRCIDIIAVHSLIPYITYYSTYYNYYYFIAMGCVFILITLFYFNAINVKHKLIHIIASFGVFNAIKSCHLNKDTCNLCSDKSEYLNI